MNKVADAIQAPPAHHPAVNEGEKYAGILLGKDGDPDRHIILLPGDLDAENHKKSEKWAESIGGYLPSRREQSLLIANLKEEFKPNWYWSGETHAADSGYAWCQHFFNGHQTSYTKYTKLRARAVRSIDIQ